MIENDKNCLKHNQKVIFTYNRRDYCKDCLEGVFTSIYELKELRNENQRFIN